MAENLADLIISYVDAKIEYELARASQDAEGYPYSANKERRAMEAAKRKLREYVAKLAEGGK